MSFISTTLVLFFVMDPLGNIPVFLSILNRVAPERRRIILIRELFIALGFLVAFLFTGRILLDLLALNQDAIRVGGGIVLFLVALRLIFPSGKEMFGDSLDGEPLVFPLAVPMIAGPSSFATILFLVEAAPLDRLQGLGAICLAWAASAIILTGSTVFLRIFGQRGLMAVERLMGMLLVMLSVQMVLEGTNAFLDSH